jgi:SWI/SNF-related matrix-associated actin-dependent regulator 1 of chromatin subfamily A
MKENNDRVLIFSQFTQCLDILESVLNTLGIAFLRLDGQTPVEARQDMIDKYYEETDITVFLLSTKAGGFGINLACANTVIIFDLSFNPHDDKQAEDRAHRVGQTRDVRVIRLVCKGTVEEKILELNNTKLALDKSVSGEGGEEEAKKNESKIEEMLMADDE